LGKNGGIQDIECQIMVFDQIADNGFFGHGFGKFQNENLGMHGYLLIQLAPKQNGLTSVYPQMVFLRSAGVGRHDLIPQNSLLFLRDKSVVRLGITQKSLFLDGH
jgi:hypothetical protein